MLVDSHAHLDSEQLLANLDPVLDRAHEAGVGAILTIASVKQSASIDQTLDLIERYPGVYAAAGVHPHDANRYDEASAGQIVESMRHPKFVAWGEIGLDFHYDFAPKEIQVEVFRRQLELALQVDKPVIIHSRNAAVETCEVIEENFARRSRRGGVMHCFTYDAKLATRCLDFGFHLGFGGILTFPKSDDIREAARAAPRERLLIETDSPYLTPVPFRGKVNEPALVALVAERLAQLRGCSLEDLGKQVLGNFQRLFDVSVPATLLG